MLPDKVIKEKYKPTFWKNPEKYYAVETLKQEGFKRFKCSKCGKPFWSVKDRDVCGDPACSGEQYSFIGKKGKNLSYTDVWLKYKKMFEKFGYTAIKRYPVVSRWNPTMEYTNASIAAFQPYIVSGEVEPPANPLVIPQLCLRFSDTDNVGVTMSHLDLFSMIGQHQFVQEKDWDQNKAFQHMLEWNKKGLGLDNKEVTFHEDAWAGGGNVGCCMEMFSGGAEIWNQVYMLYEQTPNGVQSLNKKVLIRLVKREIEKIVDKIKIQKNIKVHYAKDLVDFLSAKSFAENQGAREVIKVVRTEFESGLVDKILENKNLEKIEVKVEKGKIIFL